ncbi:MAG TPA: response regulator [Polyangiales bacterium]|nr:response regulator [Polyangiales bacterium]
MARGPSSARLLVVDDDDGSRRTLTLVLENKGFDVRAADSATQALRLMDAGCADLALVDVRLPDGLGTEVIPLLQRFAPDLVVIMMTAYANVDDAITAMNNGASGYLTKPLNLDEVIAVVRESLSKQRLARENTRLLAALQQELADRMTAELELQRLRAVIESTTTDFVGMTTPEGDVLYINHHGREMLGLGEGSDLTGLNAKDLHPAGSFSVLQNVAMPAAAKHGAWTGEITFKGPAGRDILTSMTLLSHRGAGGEVERFSTISRDITEQRKLERQLRAAQRMEALGRVAGGVAHDFNNCLQIILGQAAVMREQLRPMDPLQDSVGAVLDAGERAAERTAQLLAFSRRQTQQLVPVDINRVVFGMEPMLLRLIGPDITLCVRQGESLGLVMADEAQIEQVVTNLIANAKDAMPNGGQLTLETCNVVQDGSPQEGSVVPEPGHYVLLTVADTGTGMDEETQSHMFEPFYSTKPVDCGSGLGLSTVYGIVTQSGGFIGVDSQFGVGTSFRLYFPRCVAQQESRPSAFLKVAAPRTETILVVEDEPLVRALIRAVLKRHGFQILEAANGEEALHVSTKFAGSIALLLTDVMMPKLGGREVAEQLQKARPGIRVLYMSGYADDAIVQQGAMHHAVAFIAKPFSPQSLIAAVCAVLDEQRASTQV